MVDRAELFRVADEIHAEGRVPSHRLIRERLAGSFSDIGPLYTAWCVDRHVRPRPSKDDLPRAFQDRLAKVAAAVWCDGVEEGNRAARNERDALTAERDALRTQLTEALATLDLLERQVALLEEDRADRAARQRRRSQEFWDRVMLEIVEILGQDALDVVTIVTRLSAETRREAAGFQDGIEPSRIAEKMRTRVAHGKYFEEAAKDVFRRRASSSEASPQIDIPSATAGAAAPESLPQTREGRQGAAGQPRNMVVPPEIQTTSGRSLRTLVRQDGAHSLDEGESQGMEAAVYTVSGLPIPARGKGKTGPGTRSKDRDRDP